MIVEIFKRLSYNRITKIGFIIFGTVIAPFMFIFQFAINVFTQTSLIPLLFLSFCFGLPITLILLILVIWENVDQDSKDPIEKMENRFRQMSSTAIMTGVGFYIPCVLKFFNSEMQLREAIKYMAPFFLAIIVSSLISIWTGRTKKMHDLLMKKSKDYQDKNKLI